MVSLFKNLVCLTGSISSYTGLHVVVVAAAADGFFDAL